MTTKTTIERAIAFANLPEHGGASYRLKIWTSDGGFALVTLDQHDMLRNERDQVLFFNDSQVTVVKVDWQ
jgi:hypothetical protein